MTRLTTTTLTASILALAGAATAQNGACCIDGACEQATAGECDVLGGEFAGVGSLCSDPTAFDNPTLAEGDLYGQYAVMRGDYMAVSVPGHDMDGVSDVGKVFIYRLEPDGSWIQLQYIVAETPGSLDKFGRQMALVGDTLIISGTKPRVHVYSLIAGIFQKTAQLKIPDAPHSNTFGRSIAFDGQTLAIGDPFEGDAGSVYIYEYEAATAEWINTDKVSPNSGSFDNIAIDGDTLIVGNPYKGFDNVGQVRVFQRDPDTGLWLLHTMIENPDPGVNDHFGNRLDIDGDTIVVGSHTDEADTFYENAGGAWVFQREDGQWEFAAKLQPDWLEGKMNFGKSVDVEGDVIAVGVPNKQNGGINGQVVVFHRDYVVDTLWWEVKSLHGPSPEPENDEFGHSVYLDGGRLVVGAIHDEAEGAPPSSGRAYLFDTAVSPCDEWGPYPLPPLGGPDLDGSGFIDTVDLNIVLSSFGCLGLDCDGDVDGDGDVDSGDLNGILSGFGLPAPPGG